MGPEACSSETCILETWLVGVAFTISATLCEFGAGGDLGLPIMNGWGRRHHPLPPIRSDCGLATGYAATIHKSQGCDKC
jgi:hypothetical protein